MDDRIKLSLSVDLPEGYEDLVMSEVGATEFAKNANYSYDEVAKVGSENITISIEKL